MNVGYMLGSLDIPVIIDLEKDEVPKTPKTSKTSTTSTTSTRRTGPINPWINY